MRTTKYKLILARSGVWQISPTTPFNIVKSCESGGEFPRCLVCSKGALKKKFFKYNNISTMSQYNSYFMGVH